LVQTLLGRGRIRPVVVASLLGVPLPLCSCSVLPTALTLRKQGASKGATLSFLISTPETGVDSIALTYGLMGPFLAIYRPFAALITALTAGFATEVLGDEKEDGKDGTPGDSGAPGNSVPEDACGPSCGCGPGAEAGGEGGEGGHRAPGAPAETGSFVTRLRAGFRGAFGELFDATSHWMLGGLVISALITTFLPTELVTSYLSSGPLPLVLMLLIGIPMYICASASTPIAAALVLKGLSPGAALVFLLAGPATNIGSLAILGRFLGRRAMIIYISTIAVLSLALGGILDALHAFYQVNPVEIAGEASRMLPAWLAIPAALVFASLLFLSYRRTSPPEEFGKVARGIQRLLGIRITGRRLAGLAIALVLLGFASTFFLVVRPGERGLVRRFGAPVGEPRGEGLHLKWPPPFETAERVRTDLVRRIEIGFRSSPAADSQEPSWLDAAAGARQFEEEAYYLTGDENIIDTKSVIQYRIVDPERYVYGFVDPEATIQAETIAELIDVLAGMSIDGVYTVERRELEERAAEGLRRRFAKLDLGVELLYLSAMSVHAPPEVHAAFRDVASAKEDKETAINVAYRYLDETLNLAQGEAAAELAEAQSYSVGQVLRAQGDSLSLTERAAAYRRRPTGTYTRLYLETMEDVLAGGRKIIRPPGEGAGSLDLWISSGKEEALFLDDVLDRGGGRDRSAEGAGGAADAAANEGRVNR
jgi:HflK protein